MDRPVERVLAMKAENPINGMEWEQGWDDDRHQVCHS
jgi:hypothetical protein